jgi:hypothetical protein
MEEPLLFAVLAGCIIALTYVVNRRLMVGTRMVFQSVQAVVSAHQTHNFSSEDGNEQVFAAVYRFNHQGRDFEVADMIRSSSQPLPVGTCVTLYFPAGRPEEAQPRRLAVWVTIAVFLALLSVLLAANLFGVL